jgi:UDP-N-acetylmuramoyl-L-alanyl-D-glutamate--2,6-diaminopimelate ligase
MLLSEILKNVSTKNSSYNDVEINDIQFDSRKVGQGSLFIAVRGTAVDGHDFIEKAVENGASIVICEKIPEKFTTCNLQFTIIEVENSAETLGEIASNFYGNPSQKLKLTGVTGTNGKTTVATLLYKLFQGLGYKVGLLSTVCNYIDKMPVETTHTTPDALELNRLLAEMVEIGCEYCFMEVSSHAVVQHRISGLEFAGGIFTNLTRDHLDYHGTMENYRDAKKIFFDNLPKNAFALTNLDDKNGEFMLQNTKAEKFTYSLRTLADFKTKILENDFEGMELELRITNYKLRNDNAYFHFVTHFVGKFNASNLTAVFGVAVLLLNTQHSILNTEILQQLSTLQSVAGRFETICSNGITAIVDYAHTPDALKNMLASINYIMGRKPNGKIICVVGCGGNRDKGKRPLMAREAVNQSHTAIFTSDNPRNENPDDILADMLAGLDEAKKKNVLAISDRQQAIKTAIKLAQKGDVILIAGKGHEDYQIIGNEKRHFDDREEVRNNFKM